MNLTLRPTTQQFIDEQVKNGQFPSPEAVVEAAIAEMQAHDDLDESTIAAINEAEAQADRGEGLELDAFRAEFAKRLRPR
jgi:Arc/MetJ-type ribon-helix-helix transcriptional regulator